MAYSNDQNEPVVPTSNTEKRSSTDLLPRFFRTNPNRKFLNATVDQLIQPGAVKKINGYVGRPNAKSTTTSDIFLEAADKNRQDYQLEIAAIVEDYLGNNIFFKDYIDHVNHIGVYGGITNNHSRLNKQEFYSWNPHIDWDKFVNFQQYYWLPFGPDVIDVAGQQKQIVSTYKVETVDEEDNYAYLFTPNGLTRNPTLKLFRGQTYIFDINAPGNPFSIKTKRVDGSLFRYNFGILQNAVEQGQLVFEVPENAPDVLYYVSENNVDTGGVFQIFDIEENTFIDVEAEILGKKTYTIPNVLGSPLQLSNGMKLKFTGEVIPEKYSYDYWYVEGVGDQIRLINEKDLEVRSTYVEQKTLLFDDLPFDQVPFSEIGSLPNRKDYITINRGSLDNNAWSRYNRWFHHDVIVASAKANLKQPELNQAARAVRPIIEFDGNLKLFNHGVKFKGLVDVIDNFTTDAFSTIEGSLGYNIDGIDLVDGMRVIFNAETDILVKNKIYRVNFIKVNVPGRDINFNAETAINLSDSTITFTTEHGLSSGNQVTYFTNDNDPISGLTNRKLYWVKTITPFSISLYSDPGLTKQVEIFNISSGTHRFEVFLGLRKQIQLTEEIDATPQLGESVSIKSGISDIVENGKIIGNQGQTYWFNGETWVLSQIKFDVNQPPLFDLFDETGVSYSDTSVYEGSNFAGNKIFTYKVGTGIEDKELKFPLTYQNINNVGDIVFEFNLLNESFNYKVGLDVLSKNTDVGFLKLSEDLDRFKFENGWIKSEVKDYQPVIRIFKGNEQTNQFQIDVFDKIDLLTDLKVKVYKNSRRLKEFLEYNIVEGAVYKSINLFEDLTDSDILTIKCYSKQPKNSNGHYEFPINLQNNPLNENLNSFTLGEVLNHVESIVDNLEIFKGSFPGNGNLRDAGTISQLGTRFVQHSSPLNLSLYHIGSKNANLFKSLDKAMDDYGKFKRGFLLAAEESNFYGDVRDHVTNILQNINANKPKSSSYYLSDMFAYSASNVIEYTVLDGRIKIYPLSQPFNLKNLSNRSILIYLNGNQLVHGRDYTFGEQEFFEVLAELKEGDILEAIEYESTDGCYCPATPTKLGIYPKYVPDIFVDKSYVDKVDFYKISNLTGNQLSEFVLGNINSVIKNREIEVFFNNIRKTFIQDYTVSRENNLAKIIFNEVLQKDYIETVSVPNVLPETTKQIFLDYVHPFVDNTDLIITVDNVDKKIGTHYNVSRENNSVIITFNNVLSKGSIVKIKIPNVVEIRTPVVVVQGHDGSRTIAFDDYRDQLLLEFEKRIFNNIKVEYDKNIFDILNFIPGYTRTTDYSIDEFNKIISSSFFRWTQLVGRDFSKMIGFNSENPFTYNYNGCYTRDIKSMPKYWRGMYTYFFDTDRPHTHPWECLGFTIEPKWWQSVYGPAPYTSDNLLLWDDIRQGIIREPNRPVIRNPKLEKSILQYGSPVDEQGRLLSPFDTEYLLGRPSFPETGQFVVGDGSPVEFAWKISSYYPFAFIKACLLLNSSEVLGKCFDRSRIVKNLAGQLVYSSTGKRIKLKDILVPSVANSSENRILTAGLVNYVVDYLSGENLTRINNYKNDLKILTNKISTRLGGFTSKPKYKILLDSKNPAASSGVFVPDENYKVELIVSSPVKRVSYSGVIITKLANGFEVKGYDYLNQYFTIYPFRLDDKEITVGGISESYVNWQPEQTYVAGKIIRYDNQYYRVRVTHRTTETFDIKLYSILSELPITGGKTVWLRRGWDYNDPIVVPYNTVFPTIQDVADFLQGYSEFLIKEGFVFDTFNSNFSDIVNWKTSLKEFLFWTTQNWAVGSVISLSPAANKLSFVSNLATVDSVIDQFYDYSIFKVDGKKLEPEYINASRVDNRFDLEPSNTDDGIYCATLNLVQKEHVVILDNRTIFNDVIYDPEAGFRQEKLKILGYVTVDWNGNFEVPGFIFDNVKILEWEPWTDYYLGDIVKYKEFYYSAKSFLPGVETFDFTNWYLIENKLESRLLPNWDYRSEQFTDFYDLDTDNIDAGQQRLAQHLIGYQKRQYLENIINNDVSQYKFYQGMIAEKGTQNVLNKLFDVLSSNDQESLTFNEEWAVRVGDYGAVDSFDEVEFILDEKEFKVNPQPFEIVDRPNIELVDFVYRQRFSDIYIKPKLKFNQNIFETKVVSNYLRTSGYIREQDVILSVDSLKDLETVKELKFFEGDYIHTAFEGADWNVYRLTNTKLKIENIDYQPTKTVITCSSQVYLKENEYVRIQTSKSPNLLGFYKVLDVTLNTFAIKKLQSDVIVDTKSIVYALQPQRVKNIDDLNDFIDFKLRSNEVVWSDKNKNDFWAAYQNSAVYSQSSILNTDPGVNVNFGIATTISSNGNVCAVSSNNEITVYEKGSNSNAWRIVDRFYTDNLENTFVSFGSVIKLSKDAKWLAIAAPNGIAGQGFLYLYKRTSIGKYAVVADGTVPKEFTESSATNYGKVVNFTKTNDGYLMAISSSDTVFVYKHSDSEDDSQWQLINSFVSSEDYLFGNNIEFADFTNNLYITAPNYDDTGSLNPGDGIVYIYHFNGINYDNIPVELEYTPDDNDFENFGSSIAVSPTGEYLAVGLKLQDKTFNKKSKFNTGSVIIYKLDNNNTYQIYQKIYSRRKENNELFGSSLGFMNNGETLAIVSPNSNVQFGISFDTYVTTYDQFSYELNETVKTSKYVKDQNSPKNSEATTFDNNSTKFISVNVDCGSVDIYDKYNTKFAYGETLLNLLSRTDNYAKSLSVGANTILVSAPNAKDSNKINSGRVFSYTKPNNKFSWMPIYEQSLDVDIDKIKKSYLYNRKTNEIVTYLDVIDAKQGKIPGIADQEIKYKTYYDPAIYTKGTSSVNVDAGLNWEESQTGMLWWDLTRAKFVENNLGDLLYKSINWNKLYKTASIDIYEWVKSSILPSRWDELADTEEGLSLGISGTTRYGDDVYSLKTYYDPISQKTKNIYYFWVKNKKTTPNIEGRKLSALNVSRLIADPAGYGYSCISFNGSNSFNLVNISKYTVDRDVVLNLQQWLVDNRTNYHSEWKLISLRKDTVIPTYIEEKWFHSLIGKDEADRVVPDYKLLLKQRYGVEFKPRQGMFVNRIEALKQLVDLSNQALKKMLLADVYDLSDLKDFDSIPSNVNCLWDFTVDTEKELRFVSVENFKKPTIVPNILDGKLIDFEIVDPGYGYEKFRVYEVNTNQDPIKWYGPEISLTGTGINARAVSIINSRGSVIDYEILNPGEGYTEGTTAKIRLISVLVKSDSTSFDGWSIYSWNYDINEWVKTRTQSYDVNRYWKYIDWYKDQFNQYTKVDYLFNNTYELLVNEIPVGSIVKIRNVGSGGWSLLRKYNDIKTIDYTNNFEIIGRQNGTIEFLDSLYKPIRSYDTVLLDSTLYDNTPTAELRIILKALRDKIFINENRVDYVNLFINSLRYVLNEQIFVDWVFKTSFIKATHNLGELSQKLTYKNDNLENFEDYVKEVKPYRTKIREYVSKYDKVDNTQTSVTDFDLLPVIEENYKVKPIKTNIVDKVIVTNEDNLNIVEPVINKDPWVSWYSNVGFKLTKIKIVDSGLGYINRPKVEIIGDQLPGGTPAVAKAYITKGTVTRIDVVQPGSKWIKAPTIVLKGTIKEGGRPAKAIAVIGDGLPKSTLVKMKFDRISKTYQVTSLNEEETFSGVIISGFRTQFPLKWSPDIRFNQHSVVVNGLPVLKSEYSLSTVTKLVNNVTRYSGLLTFKEPPVRGSIITVRYSKNFDHLDSVDRINFFYNPTTGQIGKDISQLMTGIDYGGVNITGLDFKNTYGWDALPWLSESWDTQIPGYEDYTVTVTDDTVYEYRLPYILAQGEKINIYISKFDFSNKKHLPPIRLDESSYGVPSLGEWKSNQTYVIGSIVERGKTYVCIKDHTSSTSFLNDLENSNWRVYNSNAILKTIEGDGESDVIVLPPTANLQIYVEPGINPPDTEIQYGDRLIFRKQDSDGSIDPRPEDYDTKLTGGDLAYYTASGINPDDIILDGDDFVTPMTSHAPEEVVPGQIIDTLAIKVYSRPTGGCPNILFKTYTANGVDTEFVIGQYFPTNNSVIVKIDDVIKELDVDYTVDYQNNKIVFAVPPTANQLITLISLSFNSSTMLDTDYFISDGETLEYVTKAPWFPDIRATVLVNGEVANYNVFSTNSAYTDAIDSWRSRAGIRFPEALPEGALITYMIDRITTTQSASVVKSENINYNISQSTYTLQNPVGLSKPYEPNVLVKADNNILRPPSYSYFIMANDNLSYELLDSKYQSQVLNFTDINVYAYNQKLVLGLDYTISLSESIPIYGADGASSILVGGSGYTVNDILTLQGGVLDSSAVQFQVKTINSDGYILTADLVTVGSYKEIPTGPLTFTGGTGSSASATINFVTVRDNAAITIDLKPFRYTEGEKIIVEVTKDSDYFIETPTTIKFTDTLFGVNKVEVVSFYNHNVLAIERTEDLFNQTVTLDQSSPEFYEYSGKFGGIFKLRSTVPSAEFVWVIKSGVLLTANVDYKLLEDKQTVRLLEYPTIEDVVQIIAFTNIVVDDEFGFMQFKDIMNRVHYKRLNKDKSTTLVQNLGPTDKEIFVLDASTLDVPNVTNNVPGIIEINGERIEYFVVNGNVLSQLRRGTLGTGIPNVHVSGTLVQGLGASETIPYKDQLITTTVNSDGITDEITLSYIPTKDSVEVFVGGYRLKKNQYTLYSNPNIPYSPEGDTILPPEFTITNAGKIKLETVPLAGVKIMVVRKLGKVWADNGQRLGNSENLIAKFIQGAKVVWPG